jgi:DinB superfamily
MKQLGLVLVLTGLSCSPAFTQQNNSPPLSPASNRISTFIRKALSQRDEEMAVAAAKMPPDKYNFKAPPDDITFGYLTLHIADGNYLFCSSIGGVAAPQLPQLSETDPKQKLLDRLKSSFEFCTKALANLDDSHMSEALTIGDTKMFRSMAVLTLARSWATHYDLQEKYLQLSEDAPTAAK